jgi:hypothetical protein
MAASFHAVSTSQSQGDVRHWPFGSTVGAGTFPRMFLRVLGFVCGWWHLNDAFDPDLLEDAADSLDRQ